ncbi:TetR family transcriptional regulator [Corallococcus sp. H22C18031201]|uniref:TetR family transcriptional regulator n=1 Tax=Citreicoccus inhibens TaxID=2849499 RepID=UPI000E74C51C|nr:TetR family transcriptional regulator [Citreicoccus inhibens]MBU8899013.1 TetR family transcriptional regulator [Citreicoccus inhibens]RJS16558.1 TetR family transcriptional regulator [Corallococcus sp. H22C18031201]
MKLRALVMLACLAFGAPAGAASGLDVARTRAQEARAEARSLRTRQQALREELNGLASRIETLKAEHQGRLAPGSELETALRRSQELSGTLTGLAQSVSGAETEVERAHLTLHTELSDELSRLRAAWDRTSERTQRTQLLEQMRTVRMEREAVRAALPASRVPALNEAPAGGDDPEDLLARADTLRDSQDKARLRLGALRARITEVREERDLDRRMNDFLGEESMFDEHDRHLRLRTSASRGFEVETTQRRGGGSLADAPPMVNAGDSPGPTTSPGEEPGKGGPTSPPLTFNTYRATDRRTDGVAPRAQALASGAPEDLGELEAEASRLESLVRDLDGRATALERRAKELIAPVPAP